MPEEFRGYPSLLARLQVLILERSPRIVGIEGYMAAGKSHLAKQLAVDLGAARIEADDCSFRLLHPDADDSHLKGQPYVGCLDLDELSRRLSAASDAHAVVIVDGICLRNVLARIGRHADLTIYIKCIARGSGIWHDMRHLEDYKADGPKGFSELDRDIHEYHSKVEPHEKADLVLIRLE
jgi:uridine kinase